MNSQDTICMILVDDEPIIADELSDLIRDAFSPRVKLTVRTAYNGATALRLATEGPCDILISDIQMPGITGLALAERLRETNPNIFILFLTGYDDFHYAYEAFRQNAMHYLLKTEGDEVILRAVSEAIDRVLSRRRIVWQIREAQNRYEQMLPAYRRQLLTQLFVGVASEETLSELEESACGHLYVIAARADGVQGMASRLKLTAQAAVEKTLTEALGDGLLWCDSLMLDHTLVWVLSMVDDRPLADTLFQLIRKARTQLEQHLSLTLFFVVADEAVNVRGLTERYLELHGMLTQEILRGATGAAIRHTRAGGPPDAATIIGAALREPLARCLRDIKSADFDRLNDDITPILDYLKSEGSDPFAAEYAATLLGALLSHVNQNRLFTALEAADREAARASAQWFTYLTEELKKASQRQMDSAVRSIAQYVANYIHDHISEDLSTSALAEVSGYSTGYLSRVFKQEMGTSIHEYITQSRMNLARELLCNTHLRVYEIASGCGYDNTTYFIKVFKAQTGQTPQEYKQAAAARLAK